MKYVHKDHPWRALEHAAAAFDRAQLYGDCDQLHAMLDDEVTFIRSDGALCDREAFIQLFTDPLLRLDPFEIADFRLIPLSSSVAAVSGVTTFKGTDGSGPFSQSFRYSDIFVRKKDGWRAAFIQVTPVTATAGEIVSPAAVDGEGRS